MRQRTKPPLIFLEYNEINFGFLTAYIKRGHLPILRQLIEKHGVSETTSESRYEELEPWIQWVTAHTGMTLAEHKAFRLGDIVNHDIPQIWETLEESYGCSVGAISPMNAVNRLQNAAFFVPDPWTDTHVSGSCLLKAVSRAVSQAVNDNAEARISYGSALSLVLGLFAYGRLKNYPRYARYGVSSVRKPWKKALFLDRFLADIFLALWRRTRPAFSTLFLNAGAHVQHHYMFSSIAYEGPLSNPSWYVTHDVDPLLEVYSLYDEILGDVIRMEPDARIMMATGLHQDPHDHLTFYWRLRNHEAFLNKIGVPFVTVAPRMSRDFFVTCASARDAATAEAILSAAVCEDGERLFSIDNRGDDLFVMLEYSSDIAKGSRIRIGDRVYEGFDTDVAFVAIKNGRHNGIGYFLDTGAAEGELPASFPLSRMPAIIAECLTNGGDGMAVDQENQDRRVQIT